LRLIRYPACNAHPAPKGRISPLQTLEFSNMQEQNRAYSATVKAFRSTSRHRDFTYTGE
jgi:hypothetical protein